MSDEAKELNLIALVRRIVNEPTTGHLVAEVRTSLRRVRHVLSLVESVIFQGDARAMSDLKSIERCAGDYPIVFEFEYTDRVQHRKEAGPGDSDFSHWEEGVPFTAHIVAISEPLARAAFHHLFTPLQGTEHAEHCHKKIVSVKPLLVINGFAQIGRSAAA